MSRPATELPTVDLQALWNYGDPALSEERFRALEAESMAWPIGPRAELLSQLARTFSLRKRFDEAHALLDEAEALLGAAEAARARVRIALERGRSFNSAKRKDEARERFERAWELAIAADEEGLAVDAAHMLAIVADPAGSLAWNLKALALAQTSAEPDARRWVGSLCNNLGWNHHDAGDYERALAAFERGVAWQAEHKRQPGLQVAKWTVGRTLRSLGRFEEALAAQRALADEGRALGLASDGYGEEEQGECLLALGRAEEAKPHFARAVKLLEARLGSEDPRLLRMKQLAGQA